MYNPILPRLSIVKFQCIISFSFIGCQDVSFLLWSKGKPCLVYVKKFSAKSSKESVKNRDNDDSCGSKTACQDPVKSRGIKRKILIPTWVYSCCVRHEENRSESCRIVFPHMDVSRMGYGHCNILYGQIRQKSLIFFIYL